MKLTDTERVAISAMLKISGPWDSSCAIGGDVVGRLFLAGKRAGRGDMRERAAKVCDEHGFTSNGPDPLACQGCGEELAVAIRALGVDDD